MTTWLRHRISPTFEIELRYLAQTALERRVRMSEHCRRIVDASTHRQSQHRRPYRIFLNATSRYRAREKKGILNFDPIAGRVEPASHSLYRTRRLSIFGISNKSLVTARIRFRGHTATAVLNNLLSTKTWNLEGRKVLPPWLTLIS